MDRFIGSRKNRLHFRDVGKERVDQGINPIICSGCDVDVDVASAGRIASCCWRRNLSAGTAVINPVNYNIRGRQGDSGACFTACRCTSGTSRSLLDSGGCRQFSILGIVQHIGKSLLFRIGPVILIKRIPRPASCQILCQRNPITSFFQNSQAFAASLIFNTGRSRQRIVDRSTGGFVFGYIRPVLINVWIGAGGFICIA